MPPWGTSAELPPAFEGQPWLYLFTMFAQMAVALLVLEWLWRLAWSMYEQPARFRTPLNISRVILILLLFSMTCRGAGDLVFNMRYADLSPAARHWLADVDSELDGFALVPFIMAWLLDRLAGGMITFQLARLPLPMHLWPSWRQMKRPVQIGVGVFVMAFALTFLR